VRDVPLLAVLRDELATWKAAALLTDPDAYVFGTSTGRRQSKDNTRTRVLGRAIEKANDVLHKGGYTPLPVDLTQHGLRHTYISVRLALGHDLATVAEDAGHADYATTWRIYKHVLRLDEVEKQAMQALVEGRVLARSVTQEAVAAVVAPAREALAA
jgi:integrase